MDENQLTVKKCLYCETLLFDRRNDAKFCHANCRMAYFRKKKKGEEEKEETPEVPRVVSGTLEEVLLAPVDKSRCAGWRNKLKRNAQAGKERLIGN